MDKKQYYNSVTDQVKDLYSLAAIQADLCFDSAKLEKVIDVETAKKIKRVIITGCGDSFSAAGAMLPGFKLLSGIQTINAPDIMDFVCYYNENKIKRGHAAEEVLAVGISFSGGSQRVIDAIEKANALGAQSLLITKNSASKGAAAAKFVFDVETPAGCNTPGLRSYYASMVGLTALASHIGLCNGTISQQRFTEVKKSIVDYTAKFMESFDVIDEQMFQSAVEMKDLTRFEVIADANEGYSAQFVEEKVIECSGMHCDHTNSEEFAHISFMYHLPEGIGTIVLINKADLSFNRMVLTIVGCLKQHRPTIIVTDADPSEFEVKPATEEFKKSLPLFMDVNFEEELIRNAGKPVVCSIPTPPEKWMSPFVDFIPGSLFAGYHAAVNERQFFGGQYNFRTQKWAWETK